MDDRLVQRTRYILRSRTRRVQTLPEGIFPSACKHYIEWIIDSPVLGSIVSRFDAKDSEIRERVNKTLEDVVDNGLVDSYDPGTYSAKSSEEHAELCYYIVRGVSSLEKVGERFQTFAMRCLAEYISGVDPPERKDAIEVIRDVAIDGLYEYLDESLDARNVIIGLLHKYKQRSEWFHRERLRTIANSGLEGKKGERAIAIDLNSYILDQGFEFFVEPVSASGETDLLLREPEGRYLLIDAKYIASGATRADIVEKLASGFNQVFRYCSDFNEPDGYLVVFSENESKLHLDLEDSDGFSFLPIGGKLIYLIFVSIANLPSASKEGKAKSYRLKREELVQNIEETTS